MRILTPIVLLQFGPRRVLPMSTCGHFTYSTGSIRYVQSNNVTVFQMQDRFRYDLRHIAVTPLRRYRSDSTLLWRMIESDD
jgi:hypothetical protein